VVRDVLDAEADDIGAPLEVFILINIIISTIIVIGTFYLH